MIDGPSIIDDERVAIALWLYHKDLWQEFYSLLKPLSKYVHLYLGLEKGSNINEIKDIEYFDRYTVSYHDNYGADVAPFLNQLHSITEALFIKLHSKKSIIGPRQQVHWRSVLLNDLVGSEIILQSNLAAFNDRAVGLLSNKTLWWNNKEFKNSSKISQLCNILDLPYPNLKNNYFLAGNMFMSRTNMYKSIFTIDRIQKIDRLLQNERGKFSDLRSGKYAHSLERIFGYVIKQNNLRFTSPNINTIKIKNSYSSNGYFSLVILYNNYCYIEEDLCVFGRVLDIDTNSYLIEWWHRPKKYRQKYNILQTNPIIIEKCNENIR